MKQSLYDYAAEHPKTAPLEEQAIGSKTIQERWDELDKARELQSLIIRQLQKGDPPQVILYTAIKCIELFSEDEEWAQQAQGQLNKIYEDLAQLSLDIDAAEIERQRLEKLQEEYAQKLQKDIKRRIRGLEAIRAELETVLTDVESKLLAKPGEIGSEAYTQYWGLH